VKVLEQAGLNAAQLRSLAQYNDLPRTPRDAFLSPRDAFSVKLCCRTQKPVAA
jgi:hypothetical protein